MSETFQAAYQKSFDAHMKISSVSEDSKMMIAPHQPSSEVSMLRESLWAKERHIDILNNENLSLKARVSTLEAAVAQLKTPAGNVWHAKQKEIIREQSLRGLLRMFLCSTLADFTRRNSLRVLFVPLVSFDTYELPANAAYPPQEYWEEVTYGNMKLNIGIVPSGSGSSAKPVLMVKRSLSTGAEPISVFVARHESSQLEQIGTSMPYAVNNSVCNSLSSSSLLKMKPMHHDTTNNYTSGIPQSMLIIKNVNESPSMLDTYPVNSNNNHPNYYVSPFNSSTPTNDSSKMANMLISNSNPNRSLVQLSVDNDNSTGFKPYNHSLQVTGGLFATNGTNDWVANEIKNVGGQSNMFKSDVLNTNNSISNGLMLANNLVTSLVNSSAKLGLSSSLLQPLNADNLNSSSNFNYQSNTKTNEVTVYPLSIASPHYNSHEDNIDNSLNLNVLNKNSINTTENKLKAALRVGGVKRSLMNDSSSINILSELKYNSAPNSSSSTKIHKNGNLLNSNTSEAKKDYGMSLNNKFNTIETHLVKKTDMVSTEVGEFEFAFKPKNHQNNNWTDIFGAAKSRIGKEQLI